MEAFRDFVKLRGLFFLTEWAAALHAKKLEDRRASPIKTNCGEGEG